MAKKLSKTEINILAKEIVDSVLKEGTKKAQKFREEIQTRFENSEEFRKMTEVLEYLGEDITKKRGTEGQIMYSFREKFKDVNNIKDYNFTRISYEKVAHELSLEQLVSGEGLDLEKLINKYIEKYG